MSAEKEEKAGKESESEGENEEGVKKLSKAQKKKLREKKKKEEGEKQIGETEIKAESEAVKPNAPNNDNPPEKSQEQKPAKDKPKKGGKVNAAAALAKKKMEEQQKFEAQQQRLRLEFEAEQRRIQEAEEEAQRKIAAQIERKRIEEEDIKKAQIKKGVYIAPAQQQKYDRMRKQLEQQKEGVDEVQVEESETRTKRKDDVTIDYHQFFQKKVGQYRSPVCCILGHVDTGKTTLLDKIRKTNVQEGEAGGITQQIGATFFPQQKLIEQVKKCEQFFPTKVNVPGLLIIDTPGHESFSNLRSRGSSLCDIAILVIDLQHGLENQTLESLELLKKGNTPFVVALNKIDRSYGWKSQEDSSSFLTLKRQSGEAIDDYSSKLRKIIIELNSKGYNAAMYWDNKNPLEYISLIPTSGITGEGIPDLLSVIVEYSLTLEAIQKRIKVKKDRFNCTVMEVKMQEGHGTTIDCILVDGILREGDQIVLLGFDGPIVTKVKSLLTPHPMKQMRVKDSYIRHKEIYAANGLKVSAIGLDNAVAGTPLIVANTQEEVQDAKIICQNEFQNVKSKIKLEKIGVGVAASTLGSLQALLVYLDKEKIPVSHVSVGPVSKDDIQKAMKFMLSDAKEKRKKEFCCMLVFDIKVLGDAVKFAEEHEIKIFSANIIYHLTGFFNKYVEEIREERRVKGGKQAIFPCFLSQVTTFRKNGPIVLGVDVEAGVLKVGTPLCVYREGEKGDKIVKLGVVQSIEHNHKKIKEARKATGSVAISINGDPSIHSGKQFDEKDKLTSLITRRSIDCLKEHYKAEVSQDEWRLVIQLKKYFNIQ